MKYVNLLLVVLLLGMLGCSETGPVGVELEEESIAAQQDATALAKKPLWGTHYATFNPYWPGIQEEIPSGAGTLTFDEVDYGIVFYSLRSTPQGSVIHFEEKWEVYAEVPAFDYETQTLVDADPLMWGYLEGVMNVKTWKFRTNGVVEEASGVFSMWEGRHMHQVGAVVFDPFPVATSTFRLN